MTDYKDFDGTEEEVEEEARLHYFCKLTFGQFFTLMVLEIITLSFVFYLGARYGNEYLKLDVLSEARKEPVQIVREGAPQPVSKEETELRNIARDALKGDETDLKQRVQEILARDTSGAPPVGEPSYTEGSPAYGDIDRAQGDAPADTPEGKQVVLNQAPKPEEISDGEVVKVKSTLDSKFAVQVGSYPDVKEASYRVEEWKAKGYPAYMTIADLGDKGQWFRVRIGAFASKGDASNYLDDIVNKEGIDDAFVVKNEQ